MLKQAKEGNSNLAPWGEDAHRAGEGLIFECKVTPKTRNLQYSKIMFLQGGILGKHKKTD